MQKRYYLHFFTPFIILFLFTLQIQAQSNITPKLQEQIKQIKSDIKVEKVIVSEERATPSLITFDRFQEKAYSKTDEKDVIERFFNIEKTNEKIEVKQNLKYHDKISSTRYQQYYKDIKVEHGNIVSLTKEGQLAAINAEYYDIKNNNVNTIATLTEEEALLAALNFVGAETYAWTAILEYINGVNAPHIANVLYSEYENHYPKGELVLIDNYGTDIVDLDLAYKFNIYATQPLSRNWIYINAHNGEVMLKDAIIKHIDAPAETRYAGTKTIGTEIGASGSFELLNTTLGGGIETLSLEDFNLGLPLSVAAAYDLAQSFEDNDGTWTAAEHRPDDFSLPYPAHNENNNDDVGLDAHWGAEVVYNYWLDIHNRLSYDDQNAKITSFVHYGDAYDNAFWNGSYMTYGDGSYQEGTNPQGGSFAPLTSLDVCGHEIGHAICTFTSNLVYARESGAMNEGFSDIWAACTENYASSIDPSLPFDPWGIGEQIDERDNGLPPGQAASRALRWMDDPLAASNPDTYGGEEWQNPECEPNLANDQCGVHGNSGVLNKWFYLLTAGSGQPLSPGANKQTVDDELNDAGNPYSVQGLGFDKSEKITFLTETFLTPNAKFLEARIASIEAAGILYGPCGTEQNAVADAWDGVNVTGDALDCTPTIAFVGEANTVIESNGNRGCNEAKQINVPVYAITNTQENAIITAVGTGTNPATAGLDFELMTPSLSFSPGDLPKNVQVLIYNDGAIETTEEFTIYINGGKEFVVTLLDDDIDPAIGAQDDSRISEEFSTTEIPAEWNIQSAGEQGASWLFDGSKAYIGIAATGLAIYDPAAAANTTLVTEAIDARGYSNIEVSFDYTVGGEYDGTTYFDYGALMISTDGTNFVELTKYAGTCAVISCIESSGTENMTLTGYDNTVFYLGFLWYNDELLGALDGSSFSIDNLNIIGDGTPIAVTQNDNGSNQVTDGSYAYYFSDTEELIAKVEATSGDLGCLDATITEAGTSTTNFSGGIRTNKVFNIDDADNGTEPYTITLYYTNAELGGFAPESYSIVKVAGSDINGPSPETGTTTHTALPNGNHAFSASFTSGFSSFTLYSGNPILAVDLLALTATGLKHEIQLDWSTAKEENNHGFAIERRAEDEADFQKIAWVEGAGQSANTQTYQFIDTEVKNNITYYYRLKQLDFNGTFEYTETVSAQLTKAANDIEIYPNPTVDAINIYLPGNNKSTTVTLLNATGQIITSGNTANTSMQIDVHSYPSGIYFLRINQDQQQTIKRVIIKN